MEGGSNYSEIGTFGHSSLKSIYLGRNVIAYGHPFSLKPNDPNSLSSIHIGPTVTSIPNGLFYKSLQLTKIELPESLKDIGADSFAGSDNLKYIISKNKTAPINNGAFDDIVLKNGLLILPNGGKESYLSDLNWQKFNNIIEGEFVATESISIDVESINIDTNSSYQLPITILPENTSLQKLKWSSSDPWIIEVDDNGLITSSDIPGTVTISASTIDGSNLTTSIEVTSMYNSRVDEINDNEEFTVNVIGESIYISGKSPMQEVNIYDIFGKTITSTLNSIIPIDQKGIFIVRIGNHSYKIVI